MGKLTALGVRNSKAGRHGDGAGLYLLVKDSGAKSWVLRIQRDGKRRDIGLGSTAALSLSEARERAAELRKHALNGRDPIAERDRDRRPTPTFREAAKAAHEALKAGWIEKNAAAFLTSLETHAYPALGDLRVDTVEAGHIRDMLEPIWSTKPEVARKVRMRVGQVLNFSYSKGWRAAEAPGRSVTMGLTKQPRGKNFKSMPYPMVPQFLQGIIDKPPTAGRRALALQILTAARPGEIRAARWEQFDLKKGDWLRPASMMKSGEAHTVTLNRQAVALLHALREQVSAEPDDLVFPGRKGKPMSDMTMRKVMKDAGLKFDPHGFRASFRNWVAEQTDSPDPVAESALAHLVPDKVVRAYKTTNFIDMRRKLLQTWGTFIASPSARE